MSNVIDLNTFRPENKEDNDIFFPVSVITPDVIAQNGVNFDAKRFQAVVNNSTGEVLGMHGRNYRLTPNSEVFPAIDAAIRNSTLETGGMRIVDEVSHGGARTFRQYLFPEHEIAVAKDDATILRVIVQNSYDGSSGLQVTFGGYRFVCANGQVVGSTHSKQLRKNTKNLNIDDIAFGLSQGIKDYEVEASKWLKWQTTRITTEQAQKALQQLPGLSESLTDQLFGSWDDHKAEGGSNVYSLYNTLTYWSTHADVRDANQRNRASIINQRENRVTRVLNSDSFLKLAA